MGELIILKDHRDRLNRFLLVEGDYIEWSDYTGEIIISKVESIWTESTLWNAKHIPNKMQKVPFSQRGQYRFNLSGGMIVTGSCINKKLLYKDLRKRKKDITFRSLPT